MNSPTAISRTVIAEKYKKLVEVVYDFGNGETLDAVYLDGKSSVVVFPIDNNSNIIAVEQFRFSLGVRTLELPMGFIQEGETVLEAAVRELFEETGYFASEIKYFGEFANLSGETNRKVNFVLAKGLKKKYKRILGDDNYERLSNLQCKKVPLEVAHKALKKGKQMLDGVESNFALTIFAPEILKS